MTPPTPLCRCGQPLDITWPGKDGSDVCQECWEDQCNESWWALMDILYRIREPEVPKTEDK
jgi:hypothetical protein